MCPENWNKNSLKIWVRHLERDRQLRPFLGKRPAFPLSRGWVFWYPRTLTAIGFTSENNGDWEFIELPVYFSILNISRILRMFGGKLDLRYADFDMICAGYFWVLSLYSVWFKYKGHLNFLSVHAAFSLYHHCNEKYATHKFEFRAQKNSQIWY